MLLREAADRIARHRWVEGRLFEVAGRWAADGGDGEVVATVAALSHHAAWRAAQWEALVPVLHDHQPAEPSPALLDAVARASDPIERAAGLVEVLDRLVAGYEEHATGLTPVADAPVARVLRFVTLDAQDDRQAATMLLQSLLGGEEDEVRVAAHRSALSRLLLSAED